MNRKLFIGYIVLLLFFACKKEEKNDILPVQNDGRYYPLNIGTFIDYEVEYIFWDDFANTVDTSNYIFREKIESKIVNYSGDTLYRIEQFIKYHIDSAWSVPKVVYAGKGNNYIYKSEDNVQFVKLIFPIKTNGKWNGNAYNSLPRQEYKYVEVGESFSLLSVAFDKVVQVLQQDNQTAINQDFEEEIYAFDIGLIYKKSIHVRKTYNPINQTFEISSGYSLIQKYSNHGIY